MSIKKLIKSLIKLSGYQLNRVHNLEYDINKGKYDWLKHLGIETLINE
jgi:hypothetical protein